MSASQAELHVAPIQPLPVYPPNRALLAAFKGDLPAALLEETFYRCEQFVALHGIQISSEQHDLLQVLKQSHTLFDDCCCVTQREA